MKSLYNIAGFLGAQSRSNPADHGDSWRAHAKQPRLIPINPFEIEVGAVVRLIGNRTISSPNGQDLTVGKSYEVVRVDRQPGTQMAIMISDDVHDHIWAFHEDFQKVYLECNVTELNKKNLEVTREPKLIPINPNTIKVGNIVKFINGESVTRNNLLKDLTVGNNYEVVAVDHRDTLMPIKVRDDINRGVWVYADDFRQVT